MAHFKDEIAKEITQDTFKQRLDQCCLQNEMLNLMHCFI